MNLTDYNFTANLHLFEQGDQRIVLDVNSGSLHSFDDVAWDGLKLLIDHLGNWDRAESALAAKKGIIEAGEVMSELKQLADEGSLFTAESGLVAPNYPATPVIKAICLHVAHDCNLRCEYCFAGTGDFGGDRSLMSLEVGKRAIDFVLEKSAHRKHCEVDFFGGEPLINFPVVKQLVDYGRQKAANMGKTVKFTLTTNAVLLDAEVRDFLTNNDISVVLSLDGRQEINDKMRPGIDGSGSYTEIVPNIREFIAAHPDPSPYAVGNYYYVRGTYTHHNLDFDRDVIHMADLGCKQISVEPVVAAPTDDYAFVEQDLPQLAESYERLAEEYLARKGTPQEFNFFHFNLELGKGPCLPKRLSGCGAGHEYLAVSPEGNLYPCHQFVGKEQFKVGDILSGELNLDLVRQFRSAHIYNKPECRGCWARFFCSGGCHAAAYTFNEDLTKPYALGCTLQRKRLESAMYIKVKEAIG